MPCMCGDLCCRSCGPAQGNYRCSECGRWSMDGGCENPEKCNAAAAISSEAEYQACLDVGREAAEVAQEAPPQVKPE